MARKGKVADILSKALYSDDPNLYSIWYIDLGQIKDVPLPEFLKLSENFQVIPATRIIFIKKGETTLYSKTNT